MSAAGGFTPPPYPYDRLAELVELARARFGADTGDRRGGVVDCSVGTPCDAPPAGVLEALGGSGAERGYPTASGSAAYRTAASDWLGRRFGVEVDPDRELAACIGTKEMVASTPHYLHLADPERDTVLYPAVSYPTYAMGAQLAGCRAVPVPTRADGASDLAGIDPADAARALMLWVNSPANPTGALDDLDAAAAWGRDSGVPVFSDECYAEFTWRGRPRSVLESGTAGVVAVHSLSKRSNLAGVRAGFFAGDRDLVGYLADVRRHAGMMVPGPVQAAAVAALADDTHVDVQRERYHRRLETLASALGRADVPAPLPDGGFYLWVAAPPSFEDGWALAAALAEQAGILTSPGEFYGPGGRAAVRIAVVQPDDRIDLVCERLAASGLVARG